MVSSQHGRFAGRLTHTGRYRWRRQGRDSHVDGDSYPEIMARVWQKLYVVNHDGTISSEIPMFPNETSAILGGYPPPAVGESDGGGFWEIVIPCNHSVVVCLDCPGAWNPSSMFWPSGRFDAPNSGAYVPRLLRIDRTLFSAGNAGSLDSSLDASMRNMSRQYIILGGHSCTMPGVPLPGGLATPPVNWDSFTDLMLKLINGPCFVDFTGQLDSAGTATAQINTFGPLSSGSIGRIYCFAYALNNPWDFASNPVNVAIVP